MGFISAGLMLFGLDRGHRRSGGDIYQHAVSYVTTTAVLSE